MSIIKYIILTISICFILSSCNIKENNNYNPVSDPANPLSPLSPINPASPLRILK